MNGRKKNGGREGDEREGKVSKFAAVGIVYRDGERVGGRWGG